MRILITGGGGMLGSALIAQAPAGVEVHATQRTSLVKGALAYSLDLAEEPAVTELFARARPDVVIHAAYGKHDLERDVGRATLNVAAACRRTGAGLVHMSTDVVFDGEQAPYAEFAAPAPLTPYGRWKAEAERAAREIATGAALVRTSVIVRTDEENETVRQLRAGTLPPAFVDELRSAIALEDLADQLWEVALLPPERRGGVWHLAGPEAVSRFTLCVLLALRHGIDPAAVKPGLNRAHGEPRPRDLRLLTARADRELRTRARPISEALFPVG